MIKYDENTIIPIWHGNVEILSFYRSRALNHLFGGRTQVDAATAQMTRARNAVHLHRNPSLVERSFFGGLVNKNPNKINKLDMVNIEIWIYHIYIEREREKAHGFRTGSNLRYINHVQQLSISQLVQKFLPPTLDRFNHWSSHQFLEEYHWHSSTGCW